MNNIKINTLFALLICAFLAACTPKNYNYLQDLKMAKQSVCLLMAL